MFLQEIGVQDKLTDAALYDVSRKELLASSREGSATSSTLPNSTSGGV